MLFNSLPALDFRVQRAKALSVDDYRTRAQRKLPPMMWALLEGGAEDMVTQRRNESDFQQWNLRQRVLTGAKPEDLSRNVAGTQLALPLVLAPVGLNGAFHWQGELAAARAAESAGIRHISSTAASYSLEEVASNTTENHWFQLYPWGDREFVGELVKRAERLGFSALFVTVDVPTMGNREVERRAGVSLPLPALTPQRMLESVTRPRWVRDYLKHQRVTLRNFVDGSGASMAAQSAARQAGFMRPDMLSWDNLAWLREQWTGPIFVKGITDPEDAVRVVDLGFDGVVVSNHGGRQLDSMSSAISALPEVARAVDGRAQVLLDGGIRRGSDIVKALCLGADACLIGRPFVYGLASAGQAGVEDVLRILREEVERTLILMGCANLDSLDSTWIRQVGEGQARGMEQIHMEQDH